jgi:hypothetical protein
MLLPIPLNVRPVVAGCSVTNGAFEYARARYTSRCNLVSQARARWSDEERDLLPRMELPIQTARCTAELADGRRFLPFWCQQWAPEGIGWVNRISNLLILLGS